jgi:hypothetical protein
MKWQVDETNNRFFVIEILEMMNSLSLAFEPMIVVDEFRRIEQSLLS